VHDEVRSVRPSLVNDDLVRKVNERVCDDKRFTISDLSLHFPQISRTLVFFIYLFYIYIYIYTFIFPCMLHYHGVILHALFTVLHVVSFYTVYI